MSRYLPAFAVAFAVFCGPAAAQEHLIFATASPSEGPISTEIFNDWAARINEDGAGVVEIDVRHGFTMASPANFYDRVKDGVVPITWGIMTTIGGRFPLTGMVELPLLSDDAETASVAFWRLYAEGHLDAEYHDIVPLFLTAFPQSGVHLSAPLASLDDLAGARVIAGSQTNSQVIQALGGLPQSINPADAYEAIQRGTADGRFVPWTAFPLPHGGGDQLPYRGADRHGHRHGVHEPRHLGGTAARGARGHHAPFRRRSDTHSGPVL
ncbi:hypothetical protein [Roseinatronobacter sp. S2]|uniref:hypothetical protein n=1 Tax=Roseinatronobacter sp. S2 TaxID=3035471 RepID=UPI00240EC526|nr:hypothetical protein [Roseinatronobacter sp. S2]WFE74660.1 hypothetical protein P8S53_15915 [Roseinatronobacter sp. S2]